MTFRQIELLIGPLTQQSGGGPSSQAFRIFTTGRQDELRVRFNIKKTILGAPNSSQIVIYNLKEDSRNRISANLSSVQLSVGYDDNIRKLSSGGILSSIPAPSFPQIETRINALDGYGSTTFATYNRTFSQAEPVSNVVEEIARTLPNVTIGDISVNGILGPKGGSFSGRSAASLDELADQWGFSWSVQDGVFQAISDGTSSNRVFDLNTENGTLISVLPITSGPLQQVIGTEITSILDPRIRPGDQVRVNSSVSPTLNGVYTVTNIDFAGDSHGKQWECKIQSLSTPVGGVNFI